MRQPNSPKGVILKQSGRMQLSDYDENTSLKLVYVLFTSYPFFFK